MSRIGKRPIPIPAKTEVTVKSGSVEVKGPKGAITKELHPYVACSVDAQGVTITPENETKLSRALWGTYASHMKNMLQGVNEPFTKKLILEGVGYRMAVTGSNLTLNVGFSHPVIMPIPSGITVTIEKSECTITGVDKEAVGQFAANVRAKKKPEPYKGKGFRYSTEVIRRKQGKKAS